MSDNLPTYSELRMRLEGSRQAVDTLDGASCMISIIVDAMANTAEKDRASEVPVWREALLFMSRAMNAQEETAREWLAYRHKSEEPVSA